MTCCATQAGKPYHGLLFDLCSRELFLLSRLNCCLLCSSLRKPSLCPPLTYTLCFLSHHENCYPPFSSPYPSLSQANFFCHFLLLIFSPYSFVIFITFFHSSAVSPPFLSAFFTCKSYSTFLWLNAARIIDCVGMTSVSHSLRWNKPVSTCQSSEGKGRSVFAVVLHLLPNFNSYFYHFCVHLPCRRRCNTVRIQTLCFLH